jgi:hypothetical protein
MARARSNIAGFQMLMFFSSETLTTLFIDIIPKKGSNSACAFGMTKKQPSAKPITFRIFDEIKLVAYPHLDAQQLLKDLLLAR